jgi:hypothetical protein
MTRTTRKLTPLGAFVLAVALTKAQSFSSPVVHPKVDRLKLMRAIAEVESGTKDIDVPFKGTGKKGERSAFQITEKVWKEYTTESFKKASFDASLAQTIALMHLQRLQTLIEADLHAATPFVLAAVWNGGLGALRSPHKTTELYAKRVAAIYHSLE